MKFKEEARKATVLGNEITIRPVGWKTLLEMQEARDKGDEKTLMETAAKIIRECVLMEDGSPVDTDALSVGAVSALIQEISGGGEKTVSDFTGTPA